MNFNETTGDIPEGAIIGGFITRNTQSWPIYVGRGTKNRNPESISLGYFQREGIIPDSLWYYRGDAEYAGSTTHNIRLLVALFVPTEN